MTENRLMAGGFILAGAVIWCLAGWVEGKVNTGEAPLWWKAGLSLCLSVLAAVLEIYTLPLAGPVEVGGVVSLLVVGVGTNAFATKLAQILGLDKLLGAT